MKIINYKKFISADLEYILQKNIVRYIRVKYPTLRIISGKNYCHCCYSYQCQMGYTNGQCDLILLRKNKTYSSMAIELKTPTGKGILKQHQIDYLNFLEEDLGYYCMVSNNEEEIKKEIDDYLTT